MSNQQQGLVMMEFGVATSTRSLRLAMNIQKIREVLPFSRPVDLPDHYLPFIGVLDLRGVPIPVIDLHSLLLQQPLAAPGHRILVCEVQSALVALVITSTGRVLRCRDSDFLPNPGLLENVGKHLISGVLETDREQLSVLDLEAVIAAAGADLGHYKVSSGSRAARDWSGKKILVVEDSPFFQKKAASLLQTTGCEVYLAANGEEAISRLRGLGNRVDLIFSDVEMPLMSGIELARRLTEDPQTREIPLLFNSSLSNPALIRDLTAQRPKCAYLVKFDEDLILREISQLMAAA